MIVHGTERAVCMVIFQKKNDEGEKIMKNLTKNEHEQIWKIVDRAEQNDLFCDSRLNHVLDVTNAAKQFDMRLQEWLEADDENFCHDWFGIYAHINRETCRVEDLFMPRFANPTKGE